MDCFFYQYDNSRLYPENGTLRLGLLTRNSVRQRMLQPKVHFAVPKVNPCLRTVECEVNEEQNAFFARKPSVTVRAWDASAFFTGRASIAERANVRVNTRRAKVDAPADRASKSSLGTFDQCKRLLQTNDQSFGVFARVAPCLCDLQYPEYKKNAVKNYAWTTVSITVGCTAIEARKKMETLMASFRQERQKS
ncbi:hypothetical protein PR048_010319 [Dryococelus australis]|uniref:MADF domain-containing protein n=1 Tax=Dryococelus australis TaxID=614101 RepID=A0ABQ9I2E2_9NEOP|nr:hypothetical protein PR048_010319 [Dryococelus australis]